MDEVVKPKGLELLRSPFQENQISKLPKGTKAQNACKPEEKINCKICGGWHHPKIIHLDYVGHAALTDRLLDADPLWSWEPLALKDGLPAFDSTGGLWIKLTVCGHTRIGYGHAEASSFKEIGSREKEVIGDALRNAAMRFGAALDLWHKGDLHVEEHEQEQKKSAPPKKATPEPPRSHPGATPPVNTDAITSAQITKMQILMKERGHIAREDILGTLSKFFGRSVSSSKELTKEEASQWIDLHDKKSEAA